MNMIIKKANEIGNVIMSNNTIMPGHEYINRIEKAFTKVIHRDSDYFKERYTKFQNEKNLLFSGHDLNSYNCRYDCEKIVTDKYNNGEYNDYVSSVYRMFFKDKQNIIMIDPPYANDVNYGELSEFLS